MIEQKNSNGYKLIRNLLITIAAGLILNIPLSIWWASSINAHVENNTKVIEKLEIKVDELNRTVVSSMDDRYRGKDAKEDLNLRDAKIEKLESRVRAVEGKMARIHP